MWSAYGRDVQPTKSRDKAQERAHVGGSPLPPLTNQRSQPTSKKSATPPLDGSFPGFPLLKLLHEREARIATLEAELSKVLTQLMTAERAAHPQAAIAVQEKLHEAARAADQNKVAAAEEQVKLLRKRLGQVETESARLHGELAKRSEQHEHQLHELSSLREKLVLLEQPPLSAGTDVSTAHKAELEALRTGAEKNRIQHAVVLEQLVEAQKQVKMSQEEARGIKGDAGRLDQALKDAELQLSAQCAEVARLQQERAVDVEMLAKAAAEAEELQARLASAQERDQMNAMGGSEQLAAAQQQAEALREEAWSAKDDAGRLEQALKDAELQADQLTIQFMVASVVEHTVVLEQLAEAHEQGDVLRALCTDRAQDVLRLEQALKDAELQLSAQCAEVARLQQERAVDVEMLAKAAAEAAELQAMLVEAQNEADLQRQAVVQERQNLSLSDQTLMMNSLAPHPTKGATLELELAASSQEACGLVQGTTSTLHDVGQSLVSEPGYRELTPQQASSRPQSAQSSPAESRSSKALIEAEVFCSHVQNGQQNSNLRKHAEVEVPLTPLHALQDFPLSRPLSQQDSRVVTSEKEVVLAEKLRIYESMHAHMCAVHAEQMLQLEKEIQGYKKRIEEFEKTALEGAHSPLKRTKSSSTEGVWRAWSAVTFLEHRRLAPHIAHPLLCQRAADRKEYTCRLCWKLVVNPVILNNGDGLLSFGADGIRNPCGDGPYCDECIRKHLLESPTCPECQQPTTINDLIDDTRTEREVRSLVVRCAFVIEGCEWAGECRDFEAHQKNCLYAIDKELQEMLASSEAQLPPSQVLEQLAAARQQAEALREEAWSAKDDASRLEQALKDAELQLSAQCAEVARLQQERAVDVEMLAKAAAEAEELRDARGGSESGRLAAAGCGAGATEPEP